MRMRSALAGTQAQDFDPNSLRSTLPAAVRKIAAAAQAGTPLPSAGCICVCSACLLSQKPQRRPHAHAPDMHLRTGVHRHARMLFP